MYRYWNFFFIKQQLSFYFSDVLAIYTSIESKIIEILVKSVMKTADVSELFLAIFEKNDVLQYVSLFVAVACLYQK